MKPSGATPANIDDYIAAYPPDIRARLSAMRVIARRELGESFADTAATHFDFYRLTKNKDGVPGWPLWYFEFVRSIAARHAYCDVNVAFEQELHLGRRGVAPSEASR